MSIVFNTFFTTYIMLVIEIKSINQSVYITILLGYTIHISICGTWILSQRDRQIRTACIYMLVG